MCPGDRLGSLQRLLSFTLIPGRWQLLLLPDTLAYAVLEYSEVMCLAVFCHPVTLTSRDICQVKGAGPQ